MSHLNPSNNGGGGDSSSDGDTEVERIVRKRIFRGKVDYLIKWKGYGEKRNSWKFLEDLNCPGKIAEFEKSLVEEKQQKKNRKTKKNSEPKPGSSSRMNPPHNQSRKVCSSKRGGVEKEYEVEKILKERIGKRSKRLEYLVKWKDYGEEENTWVCYDKLNCPDLIADFKNPSVNLRKREIAERKAAQEKRKEEGSASAASSIFAEELHPLLNSVVLTNLSKYCSLSLLATSRLVCKTWQENSLLAWRSSATLAIKYSDEDDNDDDNYYGYYNSKPTKNCTTAGTLVEFTDFCKKQDYSKKPHQRFHLLNWEFAVSSGGKSKGKAKAKSSSSIKSQADQFWNLIKDKLTTLKLTNCTFKDATAFLEIVFQSCPKLKKLCLVNCYTPGLSSQPKDRKYVEPVCGEQPNLKSLKVYSGNSVLYLPISWLELLSHFASITSLKLGTTRKLNRHCNSARAHLTWLKLAIDAIKVIRRHDDRKLPLQRFVLDPELEISGHEDGEYQELFRLVQQANLPLETLTGILKWASVLLSQN